MKRAAVLALLLLLAIAGAVAFNATAIRRALVIWFDEGYIAPTGALTASFEGHDVERPRLEVTLDILASDLQRPTDLLFAPGDPKLVLVLEQNGKALWLDLGSGERGTLWETPVASKSELGLLGAAFHPRDRHTLFVHRTVKTEGAAARSEIVRLSLSERDLRRATVAAESVLLGLDQPYANHNAGQIAFGPDGMLYIAFGDGGFRNDPHGHGQNLQTWLGAMLRIQPSDSAYTVPADNPFVGREDALPEIWAYGLRNPWRFHFDPLGRMIVADVGQHLWEEVDFVQRADNLGWKIREGAHCFESDTCSREGLVDPIWEYDRQDGTSITGGVVVTADGPLKGRYVLGDFTSGRLWALDLPEDTAGQASAIALGKFPILPSAFARDDAGRAYVLDYGRGRLLAILPAAEAP